jgi:deferrochelatase/peroxidase EfeB
MNTAAAPSPVADLAQTPHIVLQPPPGDTVRHWLLSLDGVSLAGRRQALRALCEVLGDALAFGPVVRPTVLASLGMAFEGLEALQLPLPLRQVFRRLAPAFVEGAVLRAATRLGDTGPSAPTHWEEGFCKGATAWCLSLHGRGGDVEELRTKLHKCLGGLQPRQLHGQHFSGPNNAPGRWVHFGYRDGITDVCIHGVDSRSDALERTACEAGSLLLGQRSDMGDNPFALAAWPELARRFFANSSFGVLRKIRQETEAFEGFVGGREDLRAELCGRSPDGKPLRDRSGTYSGDWELDFKQDKDGRYCPFGSHVRRMRGAGGAHGRERPLLRRGVPYGPPLWQSQEKKERGLLSHFFCSNLEAQFEHLLGQWADRVPLGSPDRGDAKDPLCGNHESSNALWVRASGEYVQGLQPWTVTRGTLYLWYPSRFALQQLIDDRDLKAIDHWPLLP